MKNQACSRRDFIRQTATASAATALASPALFAAQKEKIPLGVQLYSVRKDCEKDLPATLNAVGKIGYQAVEFAGYYGREALLRAPAASGPCRAERGAWIR